jgi:hypothetical protein
MEGSPVFPSLTKVVVLVKEPENVYFWKRTMNNPDTKIAGTAKKTRYKNEVAVLFRLGWRRRPFDMPVDRYFANLMQINRIRISM